MIESSAGDRGAVTAKGGRGLSAGAAALFLAAFLAVVCMACEARHDSVLVPGQTSTRFLGREVEEALHAVEEVQDKLQEDPAGAEARLVLARLSLLRLRDYFLPLLQARESARDALLWHSMGNSRRALDALSAVEEILIEMNDRADPQLSRELGPSLETAVQARAATAARRADASELIERLAFRINLLLLKADLVLGPHGPLRRGTTPRSPEGRV